MPKVHTLWVTKNLHCFCKSKQHGQQNLSAPPFQTLLDRDQEGQPWLPGPDMLVASYKKKETSTPISHGLSATVLESDWWGTRVSCVDDVLSAGGIYRQRDQPAVLEAQGSPTRPEENEGGPERRRVWTSTLVTLSPQGRARILSWM